MISTIFQSLPPLCKTRWWIPTATKVLALLNSSNNLYNPPKVSFDEFYNESLDHMDLMQVQKSAWKAVKNSSFSSSIVKLASNDIFQEYCNWQNPQKPGQFSYCQYPFVISIVGKRNILTKDSEQQMILTARRWAMKKKPQCLLDLTYCLSLNIISIMLNSLGVLFKIWFDTRCPT